MLTRSAGSAGTWLQGHLNLYFYRYLKPSESKATSILFEQEIIIIKKPDKYRDKKNVNSTMTVFETAIFACFQRPKPLGERRLTTRPHGPFQREIQIIATWLYLQKDVLETKELST